jgi:hypothetical protein
MTIQMNNASIDNIDFFDIAYETFKTAPRKLFVKIVHTLIHAQHKQYIELSKQVSELDNMNYIPVTDLEEFYDLMLDSIDSIKAFKLRLDAIKDKDTLFLELYNQANKTHKLFILYMDRMGQLEVSLMLDKSA